MLEATAALRQRVSPFQRRIRGGYQPRRVRRLSENTPSWPLAPTFEAQVPLPIRFSRCCGTPLVLIYLCQYLWEPRKGDHR
jgi:hypothetical protein